MFFRCRVILLTCFIHCNAHQLQCPPQYSIFFLSRFTPIFLLLPVWNFLFAPRVATMALSGPLQSLMIPFLVWRCPLILFTAPRQPSMFRPFTLEESVGWMLDLILSSSKFVAYPHIVLFSFLTPLLKTSTLSSVPYHPVTFVRFLALFRNARIGKLFFLHPNSLRGLEREACRSDALPGPDIFFF